MPLLGDANIGYRQGINQNYDKTLYVSLKGKMESITFYHFTEDFFNQTLATIQQEMSEQVKEKLKGIKNLNLQEIFLSVTQGQGIEISSPFMTNEDTFYSYCFIPHNDINYIALEEYNNQSQDGGGTE